MKFCKNHMKAIRKLYEIIKKIKKKKAKKLCGYWEKNKKKWKIHMKVVKI